MRALVAEEGVARPLTGRPWRRPLSVVRRPARRGGGRELRAEEVVAAIDAAGPAPIVLARTPAHDPASAALLEIARMMDADVVLLPGEAPMATWTVGIALQADEADDDALLRRLEGLASGVSAGLRLAATSRPAVILRWAGWAWRRCEGCPGGGVPGGPCARCGVAIAVTG